MNIESESEDDADAASYNSNNDDHEPFEILDYSSMEKLEQHVARLEEIILQAEKDRIQQAKKRMLYLTTRCTVTGCDDKAQKGGICKKHGGKLDYIQSMGRNVVYDGGGMRQSNENQGDIVHAACRESKKITFAKSMDVRTDRGSKDFGVVTELRFQGAVWRVAIAP